MKPSGEASHHDRGGEAGSGNFRQVAVLLECRGPVAFSVRQGDPQLKAALQRKLLSRRRAGRCGKHGELGVGDAVARGHDVELARTHDHVAAHAVAVPDVAGERPGHCLQAGVRMRQHGHGHPVRTKAVQEAPGADGGEAPLRKRPQDVHGPDSSQRDFPCRPQLQARAVSGVPSGLSGRAQFFPGADFKVRHRPTLGRTPGLPAAALPATPSQAGAGRLTLEKPPGASAGEADGPTSKSWP